MLPNRLLVKTFPVIRIYCPYFSEESLSRQSRYFVNALFKHKTVALYPTSVVEAINTMPFEASSMISNQSLTSDNCLALGIGPIPNMRNMCGAPRIAFIVWETTLIDDGTRSILNKMDEIWITTEWGRAILVSNGFSSKKIKIVPLGADPNIFKPETFAGRKFKRGAFRFLCVGKWEKRKGITDLILAFCDEFHPGEQVELILHCHNKNIRYFSMESEISRIDLPAHAPIIPTCPLSESGLVALYNSCDAFVLPTKAEGWGLPITEAMACALPVIVTDYSAPTAYVNLENGFLIQVAGMVKAKDIHAYKRADHGYWAQPDIAHLKFLMRYVFEHPEEARQKGARARQDIVNKWTWDHAAQKAVVHLSKYEQASRLVLK